MKTHVRSAHMSPKGCLTALPRRALSPALALSRRFVWRLLAAMFFISCSAMAQPLSLESITSAYDHKVERLGCYELQYKEELIQIQPDVAEQTTERWVTLLVDGLKFRREVVGVGPQVSTEQIPLIETYDLEQFRSMCGKSGLIRPMSTADAYNQGLYTPVALAGLHDSSSFYTPDPTDGVCVSPMDMRAFLRAPETTLFSETVRLNNEEACVLEYQKVEGSPLIRVWLSIEKNFTLLKAETSMQNRNGESVVVTHMVNSDFEEVAPGLYIPHEAEFRNDTSAMLFDGKPEPVRITRCVLDRLTPNAASAPDSFRLVFPDDVIVRDETSMRDASGETAQEPDSSPPVNGLGKFGAIALSTASAIFVVGLLTLVIRHKRHTRMKRRE